MEKKIPLNKREEVLKKIAKTKDGQAIREWMLDSINQIESVKNIPAKVYEEGGIRLNEEIIGRIWASQYLTSMVNKLLTLKTLTKKTEEDKIKDSCR